MAGQSKAQIAEVVMWNASDYIQHSLMKLPWEKNALLAYVFKT